MSQTCATSPNLVSRAALAMPNPKPSPIQPHRHPQSYATPTPSPRLTPGPTQLETFFIPNTSPSQPHPQSQLKLTSSPIPKFVSPQRPPTQTHPYSKHISNPIPKSTPFHLKLLPVPTLTINSSPSLTLSHPIRVCFYGC